MEQEGKILQVKELTEYMRSPDIVSLMSKPERFDDIETNGELLSKREKSPLQQEVVEHAVDFIQERLQNLGIPSRPYDTKRVIFLPFYDDEVGRWKHGEWVVIAERAEANLTVVIHELIHAISSEWHYRTTSFVESLPDRRSIKTGFDVVWLKSLVPRQFQSFNEAITEKIAREITIEHADYAIDVSERGKDRLNYHLHDIDQRVSKQMEDTRDEYSQQLEVIEEEHKSAIKAQEALFQAFIAKNLPEEEFKTRAQELRDQQYQEGESYQQKIAKLREGFNKWLKIRASTISMAEEPLNSLSYNQEVTLLNLMLDGLGYKEAQNSHKTFEEACNNIWTDLQKAYFNGQVMWLRKIDQVFGKGMLRKISELAQNTPNLFRQVTADLRSKVEEIKNTPRS